MGIEQSIIITTMGKFSYHNADFVSILTQSPSTCNSTPLKRSIDLRIFSIRLNRAEASFLKFGRAMINAIASCVSLRARSELIVAVALTNELGR